MEEFSGRPSAMFAGTVTDLAQLFWDWSGHATSGCHDVTFQVMKRWRGGDTATEIRGTRRKRRSLRLPLRHRRRLSGFVAPCPSEDL
jgi:hypothetical protein